MAINIETLESDVRAIVENVSPETFIYDLLRAYGLPKASITRLQKGSYNLSKVPGEVLWKNKVLFKVERNEDIHLTIERLKSDEAVSKKNPRFIVVTEYTNLVAFDTNTRDSLDIKFNELYRFFSFFLPWAGREKVQIEIENPADVRAAEKMGGLYDAIVANNPVESDVQKHQINVFLSRLLFCFYAEDTGIFSIRSQFTNSISNHTKLDGSDLGQYFRKLFAILDNGERTQIPGYFRDFPYVNGGLFSEEVAVPNFNAKSRKIVLECGNLNWSAINPDIFGSMIQAVVNPNKRGRLGMHYTSIANIMKVIEPLFLNDLCLALDRAGSNASKLSQLLERICKIRVFDPACGSGNFLIVAFKELCKIEIEILKRLNCGQRLFAFEQRVSISQFYGVEIDNFAFETAKLSLWISKHQMNKHFEAVFSKMKPTLPLLESGNFVCGNAIRIDWSNLFQTDADAELYVVGNPPYLGYSMQSKEQKKDLQYSCKDIEGYRTLDYISCWFIKASKLISSNNAKFAFVSTNSITQGEQVAVLWPNIFKDGNEIFFAHQSFKWGNNARKNAGVVCVVIGVQSQDSTSVKRLISGESDRVVPYINPYLASGSTVFIKKRSKALSLLPNIVRGSGAVDGGHLMLTPAERQEIIRANASASEFIREAVGSAELIKRSARYCLWIESSRKENAIAIPGIKQRIELVMNFRKRSKKRATQLSASSSHLFGEPRHSNDIALVVPRVSSENREYIPINYVKRGVVVLDSAHAIYGKEMFVFSVLSSKLHMAWVKAVAGRLKTDFRYSSALCYNTFPFPEISDSKREVLEGCAFSVLDAREEHSEKTLAQLYDPEKMPENLRRAHHEMDLAVERCYRKKPFRDDDERLEYLFNLYAKMIEEEKVGGS